MFRVSKSIGYCFTHPIGDVWTLGSHAGAYTIHQVRISMSAAKILYSYSQKKKPTRYCTSCLLRLIASILRPQGRTDIAYHQGCEHELEHNGCITCYSHHFLRFNKVYVSKQKPTPNARTCCIPLLRVRVGVVTWIRPNLK